MWFFFAIYAYFCFNGRKITISHREGGSTKTPKMYYVIYERPLISMILYLYLFHDKSKSYKYEEEKTQQGNLLDLIRLQRCVSWWKWTRRDKIL